MAKFKGGYKNEYALELMARYFRNTLVYYKGAVEDDDYFDPIVQLCSDTLVEREILSRFDKDELFSSDVCRECSERGPNNGRKYKILETEVCFCQCDSTDSLKILWNEKKFNSRCRELLIAMTERYLEEHRKSAEKDPLGTRFAELKSFFKFDELEMELLKYAYVRQATAFSCDPYPGRRNNANRVLRMNFYAMAIDRSVAEVREQCKESARLRKYDFLDGDLDIRSGVQEFLDGQDSEPLQGQFFEIAKPKDVLPWDFYSATLQRHGDVLKRIVTSKKPGRGVNVLLYGAPGTGKTSFAYTLAKELGLDAYEIRHGDEDGRNKSLGSRMLGVQACNTQIPLGRGMMIVDEADQVLHTSCGGGFLGFFGFGGGATESEKGAVNSMLDSIRVPTIWISNASASSMADSVRRRFDYSICFTKMTNEMRENIWRNNVKKLKLGRLIAESDYAKYAAQYPTSAGGITMVLKNLKEMRPKRGEVEELLKSLMTPHCELMDAKATDGRLMPSKDYSLEGLNIKGAVGLEQIVEAVRNFRDEQECGIKDPDRPRMNLLLWGPPGTGKTEFIKYLAKTLNQKVSVKMGSDLLSMYVGGTEQNIKRAFAEAETDNAILFLDEIDGLVQDRSGASKSWEVTQVNELLYQMENFKGVMVGATNFMDNLDQAIMRRFTFKLQFDYLDNAGKRLFFERMFKTKLTEKEAEKLAEVRNLAPGDFRTVRQATYYLGGTVTNLQRIEELEKESSVKRDTKKASKIGF